MTTDSALNIRAAAAFLGVHEQTVRKLARSGGLPAFKVGKDWRFRKDALLRWTEEQQAGGSVFTVLIIDDDVAFGHALTDTLEEMGCRAHFAPTGAEGLNLVASVQPDLILLDLHMPVLTGPEVLEQLRSTHPDLPVVIVTGDPSGDLMTQAMGFAPLLLLAKPLDPVLLERTLATVRHE